MKTDSCSYSEFDNTNSAVKENYSENPPSLSNTVSKNNCHNQPSILKPKRTYNNSDRFFAIAALIIGFLFLKNLIYAQPSFTVGLVGSAALTSLTVFNYYYCRKCGLRITFGRLCVFIVFAILSVSCIFTNKLTLKCLAYWFTILGNLYMVYISYGERRCSIVTDAAKAVFISPFETYGSLFGALFYSGKNRFSHKRNNKNIGYTIIGLLLSIPVAVVVLFILMSGDSRFMSIFERLDITFFDSLIKNLFVFCFSVPIGMYIFGAIYSRRYKKLNQGVLNEITPINFRILPPAMCNAFLSPICLIYIAFIVTQISYLFSTVSGIDTANFDYSSYAREGFFQLCVVAVINLIMAAIVIYFSKQENKSVSFSVRAFLTAFSILTICLIVTALVKMFMYIDMYGFTPLRVYTSVFMAYLFILFIILIIKQIKWKLSFTKCAFFLAVSVMLALSFIPVDGLIAKSNIERYENGEISWMGEDAVMQLDCSAAKYLEPYINNEDVQEYFYLIDCSLEDMTLYNFDVKQYEAKLITDELKQSGKLRQF